MSPLQDFGQRSGMSGKACCTWRQLQQQWGEVRVLEGDAVRPILVHRRTMDGAQTWRRVMVDEKHQTLLELVSQERAADTIHATAPQTPLEPRQERTP